MTESKWLNDNWSKPKLPKLSNKDNFIRADDGCYEIIHSGAWGTTIVKIEDPEAGQKLTYKDKTQFKLIDNFPVLPKEEWSAWVDLAFHLCEEKIWKSTDNHGGYWTGGGTDNNEVSIVLLRKEDDYSQWKVVVPKQEVTGTAVHADFDESCDIITGEKYDVFPPVGWLHVGSVHSHNTMSSFFSSTDDRSELGIPGLHIVVGSIDKKKMNYTYKASIVLKGQRKIIEDLADVVDHTPTRQSFHPNCLDLITEKKVAVTTTQYNVRHNYSDDNDDDYGGYYGGNFGFNRNRSRKVYKLGALWDNNKSEWVYPEDLDKKFLTDQYKLLEDDDDDDDDENLEIILLPGDVARKNKVDAAALEQHFRDEIESDGPYSGSAYEEYCRLTDQAYEDDVKNEPVFLDSLSEETKAKIATQIGREVIAGDEEWLGYWLGLDSLGQAVEAMNEQLD